MAIPFEVRHSAGALIRAKASAVIAEKAYVYFRRLFSGVEPDIALIVVDEADWESRQPYGLPFFNDDDGQIRPGILVMPAGSGDFWVAIGEDLREASPRGFKRVRAAYPGGAGGVDLQPFFDLITLHELGHAFEVAGNLRLPTFWLGEIFANLALHAFVATQQPENLDDTGGPVYRRGTESAACRPDARRRVQHARGARDSLHRWRAPDGPPQLRLVPVSVAAHRGKGVRGRR